jgi:DNA-binding transcriptional regulator GbsR (MarR family)
MEQSVLETPGEPPVELNAFERQVVDFFTDGVRLVGLPKSMGEIYGLLFISQRPLALDDLVSHLGISKGSASQGLRALKTLGAVREAQCEQAGRRTYFEPDLALKRLVGGFIREQVRPHLESGRSKLELLQVATKAVEIAEEREFYQERIERLENWLRKARIMLPVMQKILGE